MNFVNKREGEDTKEACSAYPRAVITSQCFGTEVVLSTEALSSTSGRAQRKSVSDPFLDEGCSLFINTKILCPSFS